MPRLNGSQSTRIFTWKRKPPIDIDLMPPLFDTPYVILQQSGGVRLRFLRFNQYNDELAAKDLVLEGFIDGEIVNLILNAAGDGASEYYMITEFGNYWHFGGEGIITLFGEFGTLPLLCNTCDLSFRITTALGTNQEIHAILEYDAWEQV